MIEYPKIETLYNREPEGRRRVLVDQLRMPEFGNIRRWRITEKIDGANIRVGLSAGAVSFGGRTDNAQILVGLLDFLRERFTVERLSAAFNTAEGHDVILFGEGYGERIQKGGGNYRKGVGFRLFDVLVGHWWLEPEAIADVAGKLDVFVAPHLGEIDSLPRSAADLEAVIGNGGQSRAAAEDGGAGLKAEGIVARTAPMLLTRSGARVMWKLKFRDFPTN